METITTSGQRIKVGVKMAFTRPTYATNNVQLQPDEPVITAAQLKLVFDQVGIDTKAFIEDFLTELESVVGSANVGSATIAGVTGNTVFAQIQSLKALLDASDGDITALDLRVTTNEGNIATNAADIATNASDILALESADSANVKLTGNQTIAGVKTFSSSPVVPETPTTNGQAASKGYVDTVVADAVLGAIPDNSLTNIKLVSDIKIGSLATLTTTNKSSVTAAINEVDANADQAISDAADAQATADAKASLVTGTSTITTTGWVAHTGDYALKLDLTVAGILATDIVDVILDVDSLDTASDAELASTNESGVDTITFYAQTAPASTINFTYKVVR